MRSHWLIIGLAGAALFVSAEEISKKDGAAGEAAAKADTAEGKQASARGGVVAVRDPDGGIRQATPAEIRAITGSSKQLVTTQQATGPLPAASGIAVRLDPARSRVYSVVTRSADGKLAMQCVTGEPAAAHAMHAPAAARPQEVSLEK
jgi:hypothetical protein